MEVILFAFFLLLLDVIVTPFFREHLKNKLCFIPALIAAGTAAYQLYQAHQQRKQAKALKPSNYVPPAVLEAEQNARLNANSLSAGYGRSLDLLNRATATTINNAKRVGGSSSSIQQAVADADARQKNNIADLQVSEAANRQAARGQLNNLLLQKGAYQKESNDNYNAAVSALKGAAKQNTFNAITGLAEGAVMSMGDKSFGGGGGMGGMGGGGNSGAGIFNRYRYGAQPSQSGGYSF